MMKKIYLIFFATFFALFISSPIHSKAAELPCLINGYTEDGVYYEVFDESSVQQSALSRYVMRTVVYQGKVMPQMQIPWEETINEIKYSGTLILISSLYNVKENNTSATYEGILYVK